MNRQQTRGVILLLVLIVALQFAFRNCEFRHTFTPVETAVGYREMDSLRALATALKKDTIYPFNPHFITKQLLITMSMPLLNIFPNKISTQLLSKR